MKHWWVWLSLYYYTSSFYLDKKKSFCLDTIFSKTKEVLICPCWQNTVILFWVIIFLSVSATPKMTIRWQNLFQSKMEHFRFILEWTWYWHNITIIKQATYYHHWIFKENTIKIFIIYHVNIHMLRYSTKKWKKWQIANNLRRWGSL